MKYQEVLKIIKNKKVELRHDVDISLESAFRMAKFETSIGVKSIYYLRFDSDYYNLLSIQNEKIINFLINEHEIGCHVDSTNLENETQLINYLNKYNEILPFKKFTFHINTDKTKKFGVINGFENKSILKGDYISDSKCEFNENKIKEIKLKNNYTLVIHPEWWDNKNFIFTSNCKKTLVSKLNCKKIKDKSLKEILKYE